MHIYNIKPYLFVLQDHLIQSDWWAAASRRQSGDFPRRPVGYGVWRPLGTAWRTGRLQELGIQGVQSVHKRAYFGKGKLFFNEL